MKYKLIDGSANDTFDVIGTVLRNRGIENVYGYLNVDIRACNHYSQLDNINQAVECFQKHLDNADKIAILVDCDPDGYCSAAIIYRYIKHIRHDYPVSYIIHQNNKAHGLTRMADGDVTIPEGTKLLIIPDAGSNDVEQLNSLVASGIDCIVLDHHEKETCDIECNAIIVNNQMSDSYSNKDFSGAGVTNEFIFALDDVYWTDFSETTLDLVALAQVSDLMDLRSFATRYYVNEGFKCVTNPMFEALVDAQSFSMNGQVNPTTVAFNVTNILNALIRLGTYEERELLFRAFVGDYEEFDYKKRTGEVVKENIYERAVRFCKNSKSKQDRMRDKLFESLLNKANLDDKVVIVEADDADAGIVGLSAMKMASEINRPVVILRDIGNGKLGGSLRNFDNSPIEDLKELLNSTGLFISQGHSNAAGAEIAREDLEKARELLNSKLADITYDNTYQCDFVLDFYDLDLRFIKDIADYEWVWGTGVKQPLVAVTDINVARKDLVVQGKDLNSVAFEHDGIKYVVFKLDKDNQLLKFACDWGDKEETITLDAVVTCGINFYKGIAQPQCIIKDFNTTK